MKALLENAAQILALLLSFCAIVGLAGKYVVLPWLEDRFAPLASKVEETHRQVTVNGHKSPEPTMLDKVDRLATEVRELKGEKRHDHDEIHRAMRGMSSMWEGHLVWSEAEVQRLWTAINERNQHDGDEHERRRHDGREQRPDRPAAGRHARPGGE